MKFLVTGSSGLVGSQVVKDLVQQNHTVYSCYHNEKPSHGTDVLLDLTDKNKIIQTLQETKPDRIIHLAAMTNVDLCETEKELATKLNILSTEILAKQAAKQQAFFVYVSTDYVFDGLNGMKKEDDSTNPIGFYGKSKLDGELTLNNLASNWCIARTSTPFGIHPTKKSFPLCLEVGSELAAGSGLSRALEAAHHDDGGTGVDHHDAGLDGPDQLDELPVNDADHLLAGLEALGDLAAHGFGEHVGDEVLDDVEVHVRLEQGGAHLAHGLGDVVLGNPPASGEAAKGGVEAIGE